LLTVFQRHSVRFTGRAVNLTTTRMPNVHNWNVLLEQIQCLTICARTLLPLYVKSRVIIFQFPSFDLKTFLLASDCTIDCPKGMCFNSSGVCQPIPAGQNYTRSDFQCSPCSPGKFADLVKGGPCSNCPIGTYSTSFGSTSCSSCPPGKFSNISGVSTASCMTCPSGRSTVREGLTTCDSCATDFYPESKLTNSTCVPCPNLSGVFCPEGAQVPFIEGGYYRNLSNPGDISTCIPSEACEAAGFGNTTCSSGYFGESCANCADPFSEMEQSAQNA
jgi:hypothetical protein